MTFSKIGLNKNLQKAIADLGFETPTPIQQESVPYLLENETDLIALAQTGTGKTIAFLVPVIEKILKPNQNNQALILAPTRELASQIQSVIKQLLYKIERVSSVLLIGGASITKQQQAIRKNISIVVGTPGRRIPM